MVSTASCPKSLFESDLVREYASSIKSIPPFASFILACVFIAVCPIYPATRDDLSTSTTCPLVRTPISLYNAPRILATVVLPVPGLPVNTRCKETGTVFKPIVFLFCCIFTKLVSAFISFFMLSSPIRLSSSLYGSDTVFSLFILVVNDLSNRLNPEKLKELKVLNELVSMVLSFTGPFSNGLDIVIILKNEISFCLS